MVLAAIVAAAFASAPACGGVGAAGTPTPCGAVDPATGLVAHCGEGGWCVCNPATRGCAVAHRPCVTGYLFPTGLCISPADLLTLVPSTPSERTPCPAGDDADVQDDAGADIEEDAVPEDADDIEDPPDGPRTIELTVFAGEQVYAAPADRREVAREFVFPLSQPYERVLLEYRLRMGCPQVCETTARLTNVTMRMEDGTTVELLRAMTPIGAGGVFTEDLTDLAAWLVGRKRLAVFVDVVDGAWVVDLRLLMSTGEPPRDVLAAIPLAYNREMTAATPSPSRRIRIPAGAASAVLRYRASGHGADAEGCDERCPRRSAIAIDGADSIAIVPWRTDCADFVDANPAADPGDVAVPRSGWCPADLVRTETLDATPWLAPGARTIDLRIEEMAPAAVWAASLDLVTYR